jgi:hypothetical protein
MTIKKQEAAAAAVGGFSALLLILIGSMMMVVTVVITAFWVLGHPCPSWLPHTHVGALRLSFVSCGSAVYVKMFCTLRSSAAEERSHHAVWSQAVTVSVGHATRQPPVIARSHLYTTNSCDNNSKA